MIEQPKETNRYKQIKKYIPEIIEWTRQGVTKKDIAKTLNIGYKTLFEWIQRYPEFKEAFDTGSDLLFDDIEASLYKSSKWQTITEEWYDENNELTKKFVKQIAPNQRAIEYTLNNRRPEKWKSDTKTIDVSLSEKMREKLSELSINDIIALANMDINELSSNDNETVED